MTDHYVTSQQNITQLWLIKEIRRLTKEIRESTITVYHHKSRIHHIQFWTDILENFIGSVIVLIDTVIFDRFIGLVI